MGLSLFLKKFDWVLLGLVLAIILLSLGTFYHNGVRSEQIMQKQTVAAILGLILVVLTSLFDYRIFKNYSFASIFFYVISLIFLLMALAQPAVRGSHSWIFVGSYGFQPSEFAKLAVLILLAKYFSQKHIEIYRWHHILASGIYTAVPAMLILVQPDFGSMVVFVILWLAMLFFSGIKRKHLLTILMVGLIIFAFAWFLAFKPYQKARLISFINPYLDPRGIGYNAIQAQTTFGSGRFLGALFDQSGKKFAVLVPERYTDFAFAAFGQRFGFVGVLILLSILTALIIRISSVASRTSNNFAKLYSLGLVTLIITHVFMNAGMNLGLLPITGIPFSFLSYGGSHLITLMAGLGLLESIRIRG